MLICYNFTYTIDTIQLNLKCVAWQCLIFTLLPIPAFNIIYLPASHRDLYTTHCTYLNVLVVCYPYHGHGKPTTNKQTIQPLPLLYAAAQMAEHRQRHKVLALRRMNTSTHHIWYTMCIHIVIVCMHICNARAYLVYTNYQFLGLCVRVFALRNFKLHTNLWAEHRNSIPNSVFCLVVVVVQTFHFTIVSIASYQIQNVTQSTRAYGAF